MNKFGNNASAINNSVMEIGKGSVYASVKNKVTGKWSSYKSLGLQTAMSIAFDKTRTDINQSNFEKNYIFKSIVTEQTVTLTIDFREFKVDNLKLMLNSKSKKVASATDTLELTLEKDSITKTDGVFIPLQGGVDEITSVTVASSNVLVLNKNYKIQNGSLYIMSTDEQTAASASSMVTTADEVELEIIFKTRAHEVLEFDTEEESEIRLYIEMYNTLEPEKLKQYYIHRTKFSADSLPIKADNDDALSYTATCVLLPSEEILDPAESVYYKLVVID